MFSEKEAAMRELIHLLRLTEGVEDRQADLMRQVQAVRARQAARIRDIVRLLAIIYGGSQITRTVVPVKPLEFEPGLVIWSLRIGECQEDSSFWCSIDDGTWFRMGLRLVGLLRFLAESDKDPGGEEVVSYRSRSAIHAYLENTGGGRKYDEQYVNKIVKKLRDLLHLQDKRILVISKKEGYRLMIRPSAIQFVRLDKVPVRQRAGGRLVINAGAGASSAPGRLTSSRKALPVESGVLS
jgi:hypothetical protein